MQNVCYRLKNRFSNLSINLLHAKANEVTSFYSGTICNNVPDHYKYIAGLFVIISGRNRFNTLHMFQNINIT